MRGICLQEAYKKELSEPQSFIRFGCHGQKQFNNAAHLLDSFDIRHHFVYCLLHVLRYEPLIFVCRAGLDSLRPAKAYDVFANRL